MSKLTVHLFTSSNSNIWRLMFKTKNFYIAPFRTFWEAPQGTRYYLRLRFHRFPSIIASIGIDSPWMGIYENGMEVDTNRFSINGKTFEWISEASEKRLLSSISMILAPLGLLTLNLKGSYACVRNAFWFNCEFNLFLRNQKGNWIKHKVSTLQLFNSSRTFQLTSSTLCLA